MDEQGKRASQHMQDDVEILDSKINSKNKSSQKNEINPEIITLNESDADLSVEECNPNDLVLVDEWEPESFVWDATPNMDTESHIYYKTNFKSVLREYGEENKEKKSLDAPRNCCFNCMGDHMVGDCPEPRNYQLIAKNRRIHANRNGGMKQTRYHLAEELIYAHLAPGKLSQDLRHELGLRESQLPRHIYMMRKMGYPPAWLEELKLFQSGIEMYDSDDGEGNNSEEPTVMYDTSKIIEYPGYNVLPPRGTVDESRYIRCPPLLEHQSKDAMIKHMEILNRDAERARNRLATKAKALYCTDREMITVDMEGEPDESSFTPEVSKSALISPTANNDAAIDSPTLEDLETQKKLLMAELEGSCKAFNAKKYATPEQIANVGKVKHIDLGTPILKSASPYLKIPAPDNFSRGICDVINFENLPNSTGHYLRMNSVLLKIRKSLATDIDSSENDVRSGKK